MGLSDQSVASCRKCSISSQMEGSRTAERSRCTSFFLLSRDGDGDHHLGVEAPECHLEACNGLKDSVS